jgi:hypothetical protein
MVILKSIHANPNGDKSRCGQSLVAEHDSEQESTNESDGLHQRQVVGAIDLAHASFAQQRDYAIAARKQSAWQGRPSVMLYSEATATLPGAAAEPDDGRSGHGVPLPTIGAEKSTVAASSVLLTGAPQREQNVPPHEFRLHKMSRKPYVIPGSVYRARMGIMSRISI